MDENSSSWFSTLAAYASLSVWMKIYYGDDRSRKGKNLPPLNHYRLKQQKFIHLLLTYF
jgi:hypothetical protein